MASRGFLFCGALACVFPGTICNPAQNPLLHQVNGLLGGSVLLPLNKSSAKLVSEIEWTFRTKNSRTHLIAEFRNGIWERFNSSFGRRLEMAEKTMLRINDLQMEDSGEYKAHVRLTTAQIEEHTFSLAVYEPVPEPEIVLQLISNTPDRCNVTLQCQAFGKEGFNVSWETGNPPRTLRGGSDWYQLSDSGSDLHVSWQPNFSDTTFMCLASNPADQKKVSFDLHSICSSKGGNQTRRKWPILVSLSVLVLIMSAVGGIWLLKKRRKP